MQNKTINLSNFIVKVYRKKDNKISFHLGTHILFQSEDYFASTDLEKIECSFLIKDDLELRFQKIKTIVSNTDYDYSFNGKAKVIQLHMETVTDYMHLENRVVELEMKFKFKEHNYIREEEYSIRNYGLLRKMFDERFED
ncbi:hypothetical protein [uncultured Aquimarina sp.]|uniref:hypothetical protein n=1 Tax=uncultured Aquimarina sp. TaxID=575652 RepID=UPI00261B666C|nr:hypothetical protein [uncultured Aquimarina sp.]